MRSSETNECRSMPFACLWGYLFLQLPSLIVASRFVCLINRSCNNNNNINADEPADSRLFVCYISRHEISFRRRKFLNLVTESINTHNCIWMANVAHCSIVSIVSTLKPRTLISGPHTWSIVSPIVLRRFAMAIIIRILYIEEKAEEDE